MILQASQYQRRLELALALAWASLQSPLLSTF